MRDGWRQATLGELFELSHDRLGDHDVEPIVLSISKYDGVMPADEFFGKRVASAKLHDYKVLPNSAWVYSTIHIDEGSIARNTTGVDGVVSPMYTVMHWVSERDDARYAELLLRSAEMLATYSDNAQGSVNRRRSLPWKTFSGIAVSLPTHDEQRRIVDLIAAVDNAIGAAESEFRAASALLGSVLDATHAEATVQVGDVASIASGASWSKSQVREGAGDGTTPVLTIANTRPDGAVEGEPTHVSGLSGKTARLSASSIIAIRTNGNHDRIGNVYRTPEDYVGSAVSAFQFAIDAVEPIDADFLYWMLSRPSFQFAVTNSASGSTGLGNIAATKLRAMEIPWPADTSERADLVALFDALAWCVDSARLTTAALRALRSNLLTVLLSGEHGVPSSYDKVLGEVAA